MLNLIFIIRYILSEFVFLRIRVLQKNKIEHVIS